MILRTLFVLAIITLFIVAAIVIAGCSFSPPKNTGERSVALLPAGEGELAQVVARSEAQHPGLSGVVPLANGSDANGTYLSFFGCPCVATSARAMDLDWTSSL